MGSGQSSLGSFDDGPNEGARGRDPAPPRGGRPPEDAVPGEPAPLSVTQATRIIKDLLTTDPGLQDRRVEGEVSNYSLSRRGHLYFTLKDEGAQMPCVMFGSGGRPVEVDVEDGDQVLVMGRIDVYEPHGKYQLKVSSISRRGVGDLYQRFLELKDRLEKEGLFAEERKRPLPRLPRRIGVVTSATGSVFHDIVRVIRRRYPHVRVTLAHASVQGDLAAPELVEGLRLVAGLDDVDVVIIGRGGGSFEDLWPFNDEGLARAIVACPVPVVSAVGHETDFSISDFVADRRAPTPSAAAEMAVPSAVDETRMLRAHGERLLSATVQRVARERDRLLRLSRTPALLRPRDMLETRLQRLDEQARRLATSTRYGMERERARLSSLEERLTALSPASTLERGYSMALDGEGNLITSVDRVRPGDAMEVVLSDGRVDARAERVRPDDDDR